MFREQDSSMSGRDPHHVSTWHPIHATPSQDMWELPSSSTATSSLELEFSPGFDEEQQDHLEENFSRLYTSSRSNGTSMPSGNDTISSESKPQVLCDATNIVRSRTSQRTVRRSQFN
jgi:hypothetical protein